MYVESVTLIDICDFCLVVVLVRLPQLLLLRRGRRVVRVVLRPQRLPEKAWTQTRDGINYHQIPTPLLFDRGREKNNMKIKKMRRKTTFFKRSILQEPISVIIYVLQVCILQTS